MRYSLDGTLQCMLSVISKLASQVPSSTCMECDAHRQFDKFKSSTFINHSKLTDRHVNYGTGSIDVHYGMDKICFRDAGKDHAAEAAALNKSQELHKETYDHVTRHSMAAAGVRVCVCVCVCACVCVCVCVSACEHFFDVNIAFPN